MSIEETIARAVDKAVRAAITAEFAKLEKKLAADKSKAEKAKAEDKDELMPIKDTLKALHTTRANLQILIDEGKIKTCTPPNGKMQVVASSVYEFMRGA